MTEVERELQAKLAVVSEAFPKERLEEMKKNLPRDYDVLRALQQRIATEFDFLVDAALTEGLAGNFEQATLYHKLSFQCLQINGMLMEHARSEGPMGYYLDARKK